MNCNLRLVGMLIAITPIAAWARENPPGVTEVAPGVREVDGAKVPATAIGFTALKSAIDGNRSFKATKKLFTVPGISAPGPSGTTTWMYKIRDPETGAIGVAILFVKGDKVVDFMVT